MSFLSCLQVLAVGLAVAGSSTQTSPSDGRNAAELRRITQEMLDAVAPGTAATWDRYLDANYIHMDESGVVRNKEELLREFQPLPPGLVGRIEIDRFQTAFHDRTAVVAYEIQEYLDYHGQPLRTRFRTLDTWLSTPSGWRLIATHVAAVLKDPPAVDLPREDLAEYEGVYALTPAIKTTIRSGDDGLVSNRTDRPEAKYQAEIRDVFFVAGQPRTRRIFTRDGKGRVTGFVDRLEGEDIRWTRSDEGAGD